MTDKTRYIIDRALHWCSALLILFLLLDMGTKIHTTDYTVKGAVQHKQDAIEIHLVAGIILLLILAARLVWYRYALPAKHRLTYNSPGHKWLVRGVHSSMYLVLCLLMGSGWLMISNYEHSLNILGLVDFSLDNIDQQLFFSANQWHLWLESGIYALIAFHVAGAMYSRR